FAAQLQHSGLDRDTARRYATRAARPGSLTGPINWYRALPLEIRQQLGPIGIPTLFVWGDGDGFVTRTAAERCDRHVSGPYRFAALPGATHWLPTGSADELGPLLLEALAGGPGQEDLGAILDRWPLPTAWPKKPAPICASTRPTRSTGILGATRRLRLPASGMCP